MDHLVSNGMHMELTIWEIISIKEKNDDTAFGKLLNYSFLKVQA